MQKKKTVKILLVASTTIVLIYLILANISIAKTLEEIKNIGVKTLLICFLIHFFVFIFRTWPMSVILKKVPFPKMLNAHLIHNFYLQIIPASLGELTLPELLKESSPRSETLMGLIVARLYSIVVVMFFFLISLAVLIRDFRFLQFEMKQAYIWLTGVLIVMIAFTVLFRKRIVQIRFLKKMFDKIATLLIQAKQMLLRSFQPKNLFYIILSNVLYLLLMALFYKVLLVQLGVELNIVQILFIMSIQVAILLLPIKSFGGFGTTEGSWMLGMMVLGMHRTLALETGFIIHIVALLSAFLFFVTGLGIRRVKHIWVFSHNNDGDVYEQN